MEIGNKNKLAYGKIFALFINAVLIVDLFRMVFYGNTIVVNTIQYGLYFGTAFYVYWHITVIGKLKINRNTFVFWLTVIIVTVISYFSTPEVTKGYVYFVEFLILRSLPGFYLAANMDEDTTAIAFDSMIKYRFVWALYALIGMIWIPLHTNSWNQYSMTYGYNLLIPVCIMFYLFVKMSKLKYLIYSIVLTIPILLRGSRGSMICFLVFAVLTYVLVNRNSMNFGRIARVLAVTIMCAFVIIEFKSIMMILSSLFPSSRTIYVFANDISFDSGRSSIQNIYWDAIYKNPLRFNGIFSDRVYYSTINGGSFDLTNHPHNLIVEVLYQFGVPLGFLFLVLIFVISLRCINNSLKIIRQEILCVALFLFVSGIIKLFFSASYLITVEFYMFLGFAFAVSSIYKSQEC